jgi:DNA-binding NarL/FixJ family response regulator
VTQVLIVDDQPAFRRHLRRLLTYAGLEVVGEAAGIPEAEALVQRLRPDLAVVDVMMPGTNGLEGVKRLKAQVPDLRVILVSAYADRAAALQQAAVSVGAEGFVPKDNLDLGVVRAWDIEVE